LDFREPLAEETPTRRASRRKSSLPFHFSSNGAILRHIGAVRDHLEESAAALRGVFRSPGLRRIELAFLGSITGIYANVVAVSIYAFHHGGPTAVGLVMAARMGAAAAASPFTASLADRHEQRRVMLATDLVRVGTVAATAAAALAGIPAGVFVLAVLTSVASTAFRPAEASLIPRLAGTPEELTAANVSSSVFDSFGTFAGPAGGALLYAVGGPALAFAAVSLAYLWSAVFVARIPSVEQPLPPPADVRRRQLRHKDAVGDEVSLPQPARLLLHAIQPLQAEPLPHDWCAAHLPGHHIERSADAVTDIDTKFLAPLAEKVFLLR